MKEKKFYPNWLFHGTKFENKSERNKLEGRNKKLMEKGSWAFSAK